MRFHLFIKPMDKQKIIILTSILLIIITFLWYRGEMNKLEECDRQYEINKNYDLAKATNEYFDCIN